MKTGALVLAAALAVLPLGAQEPPAAPAAPEELLPIGPSISAIEIRSEIQLADSEELERLLSFQVGEPLTDESVQSTLRNLQASGYASSVEIYVRPADRPGQIGNGVVVIVVLRPVERVREVRVEGELGLDRSELRRVLPQKEAEPLSEESVIQGVYNLVDLYSDRGWFGATVRVRVDTDPQTDLTTVTYDVRSGVRSRVGAVRFDGDLGTVTPADLVKQLDQRPGEPFSRPAARDDAEDLERWLVQQGYRTARVTAPAELADPETHTVGLVFPVAVGPKVVVEVEGADADRLRRRGLLPFLGPEGYDEALVIQAVERIKRAYQEDGNYRVQVSYDEQRTDDLLRVVLRIVPGPEYTIRSVSFAGNQTFPDDQLDELVKTAPRSLLAIGSGRLVDDDLDEDVKNLRRFYQLQGFSQVEVGPAQIEEVGDGLEVTLPIQEGPQMRVVNLDLQGLEDLDRDAVRSALLLKDGGPFHPYLLEQSLEGLRAAFRDEGYAAAQVSANQDWNPDHTRVDVTVQALPGLQTVLDRVIVRGNRRTLSEVIRRTMGADPGEPISERRALEIERELYRLGIFSSVDVELTRAGLEESTRDLIVRVEEGRPRRVSYGLGFEYSSDETEQSKWSPRGSVSFSHNNVAGRAYSLRTDLRYSWQRDAIVRVRFDQPYTARWALPMSYSLFYFDERKDDWKVRRLGGRVETAKIYPDRRVGLALDYRIVDTDLDFGFPERGVDREDRPYQLLDLVPSFLWDRRNDPVLATRGWSSLAQLQYSIPAFGTDGDFLKLFFQQTQYLDLRNYGTVAMSLRAGGIEPFRHLENDDPELPETLPNSDIFIDERFFAGGATSHRAYGRDDLGIRGETLIPNLDDPDTFASVGGNGLLLYNLEYRFPLFGAVGGTVFYDAGNVWADWRDLDLSGLKQGAGVGLRYLSPIGPLRVDIGWKLDRERGEDPYAVTVSFGNPF